MNFEERVLRHEDQLNETDDDIVAYIRSHRQEIMKLSIQKIAADLFIAPNAVMRLSKKLEYSGFSELKFSVLYFWGEDREVQGYNVTDRSGLMVLVRLLSEEFWQGYVEL